jgi:O-antigen/teichoic acid export membrane protein
MNNKLCPAERNLRLHRPVLGSVAISLGFVDQLVISASNFVTALFVARSVTVQEFGVYSLLLGTLYLANGIQNALVTNPHAILASPLEPTDYREFTASAAAFQVCLSAVILVSFLLVSVAFRSVSRDVAETLAFAGLACLMWQMQEFSRRILYSRARYLPALKNDLINYGLLAVVTAALALSGKLSLSTAFIAMASFSGIAALVGYFQVRSYLSANPQSGFRVCDLKQMWSYGRWLLGSAIAGWTSSQLYSFAAAAIVGLHASAALRVAQTILGPMGIIIRFVETTLSPRASVVATKGGRDELSKLLRKIALITVPGFAFFATVVAVWAHPIVNLLFGESYLEYSWVLAGVALASVLLLASSILALGLQAQARSTPLFAGNVAVSIFALTVGLGITWVFGLKGVVLGFAAQNALLLALLFEFYKQTAPRTAGQLSKKIGLVD